MSRGFYNYPTKPAFVIPCHCGSREAYWHGDTARIYCCDACWERHGGKGMSDAGYETETATTYGTLMSYDTAETIRPATAEERAASIDAAKRDGGAGVILVHGRSCYVED